MSGDKRGLAAAVLRLLGRDKHRHRTGTRTAHLAVLDFTGGTGTTCTPLKSTPGECLLVLLDSPFGLSRRKERRPTIHGVLPKNKMRQCVRPHAETQEGTIPLNLLDSKVEKRPAVYNAGTVHLEGLVVSLRTIPFMDLKSIFRVGVRERTHTAIPFYFRRNGSK